MTLQPWPPIQLQTSKSPSSGWVGTYARYLIWMSWNICLVPHLDELEHTLGYHWKACTMRYMIIRNLAQETTVIGYHLHQFTLWFVDFENSPTPQLLFFMPKDLHLVKPDHHRPLELPHALSSILETSMDSCKLNGRLLAWKIFPSSTFGPWATYWKQDWAMIWLISFHSIFTFLAEPFRVGWAHL